MSGRTGASGGLEQSRVPIPAVQRGRRPQRRPYGRGTRFGQSDRRQSSDDQSENLLPSLGARSRGPGYVNQRVPQRSSADAKDHSWNLRSIQLMPLCKLKPDELVRKLSNDIKAFQQTLQYQKTLARPGIMAAIVQILSTLADALQSGSEDHRSQASQILAEAFSSRCNVFQLQLKLYVGSLKTPSSGERVHVHTMHMRVHETLEYKVQKLCNLFKALLTSLPESSWSCLPADELLETVQHLNPTYSVGGLKLKREAEEIVDLRNHIRQTTAEKKRQSQETAVTEDWDNSEYRQLQILPRWEEVCTTGPPSKLRKNIVNGSYTDWMHYYDVQFRLLREDFVAPLRTGVCEYLLGVHGRKLQNVKVYQNVTVTEPLFTKAGICYRLEFDVSHFKHCNWEHSKRLLFGSLLCLSPDDFQSVIFFATVSNRDSKQLAEGQLEVQFEEGARILPFCKKANFIMVESLAYFEASRHILHSLQTAEVDTMPFTRYIVHNECNSVSPPQYLSVDVKAREDWEPECQFFGASEYNRLRRLVKDTVKYNLNCLYGTNKKPPSLANAAPNTINLPLIQKSTPSLHKYIFGKVTNPDSENESTSDDTEEEELVDIQGEAARAFSRDLTIDVRDITQWPSPDEIELDQSQLEAIQMALTQEIAVIQGPPGTGKTYIGMKIVEALLQNRRVWDPECQSPILVMCLTNHALDQFLEGIMSQPSLYVPDPDGEHDKRVIIPRGKAKARVVRVGGRCQSEIVKPFGIDKRRQNVYLPGHILHNKRELNDRVRDTTDKINAQELRMYNECRNSVLALPRLQRIMDPGHHYELVHATESREEYNRCLDIWLGLCSVEVLVKGPPPSTMGSEGKTNAMTHNQPQPPSSPVDAAPLLQETAPLCPKASDNLTNPDLENESTSTDTEEEELVDIQGEAAVEEAARALDHEMDDYRALQLKPPPVRAFTATGFQEAKAEDVNWFEAGSLTLGDDSESRDTVTTAAEPIVTRFVRYEESAAEIFQWGINQPSMTESEAVSVGDINQLLLQDRWRLYNHWIDKYLEEVIDQNETAFRQYNRLCKEYKEACQQADRFALETADIIGMTTTGAAKYQHILHLVKPKIVIVEEAAEVLESHIVSTLNAGTQHLILIGDHKQLRPKPNEYNLAKNYKLDVSLFERLVHRGFPHATLQIQHRMRPQIAELVCPHIYDTLINHESVLQYRDVRGVSKNLFFIQHESLEKGDENLMSHSNAHEASYIAALCKYLLQQDYQPSQITVLVTYTGQLLNVRKQMPKRDYDGVRISTVDNFQGEENDIILLSLVRSNEEGKIGFLRENNRVCVALSRAKMGFYCIGNFKILRENAVIWERIMSDMEKKGCLGDGLPLYCCNHREVTSVASSPDDFAEKTPNGGCLRDCEYRLPCGHVCVQKCHIKDPAHKEYHCKKPCARKCPKDHPCPMVCYEECMPCIVKVEKAMPLCGHVQEMNCHQEPSRVVCKNPCSKSCPSGHRCPDLCYIKPCKRCQVPVPKIIPLCGHEQTVPCWLDPAQYLCMADCTSKCKNGHPCPKRCHQLCGECSIPVNKTILECGHSIMLPCHQDPNHDLCSEPCRKQLPCKHHCGLRCGQPCNSKPCNVKVTIELACGHEKKLPCHMSSDPVAMKCQKPCERLLQSCSHTCQNKCSDPCTEQCTKVVNKFWPCGHKLKRKCFQAQNPKEYPCQKQCDKKLSCGHKCANTCDKECTEKCKEPVERKYPCGHTNMVPCSSTSRERPCRSKCGIKLACGHDCEEVCSTCYSTRIHKPCKYGATIANYCGHVFPVECLNLEYTHPGKQPCNASCPHLKCSHDCGTECPPCMDPCMWSCPHYQCHKLCHEVCDRPPCDERCQMKLNCGHQCFGICGEPCLSFCPLCPKERKKFLGKLKEAKQFNEDVLYFQLGCGHIFPAVFLDAYMNPKPVGDIQVAPRKCPVPGCKHQISTGYRYGNSVKQSLQDVRVVGDLVQVQQARCSLSDVHREALKGKVLQTIDKNMESEEPEPVHSFLRAPPQSKVKSMKKAGWVYQQAQNAICRFKPYPPVTELLLQLKAYLRGTTTINTQQELLINLLMNAIEYLTTIDALGLSKYTPTELGQNVSNTHQQVILYIRFLHFVMGKGVKSRLSLQLKQELLSEQYRLALVIHYCAARHIGQIHPDSKEEVHSSSYQSMARFLKVVEADHSKKVTRATYDKYTELLDIDFLQDVEFESGESAQLLKGQWYKCTKGHYYCTPPAREMTVEYRCPKCIKH